MFQCQECGKALSASAAERASITGCPRCGGTDIDLQSCNRPLSERAQQIRDAGFWLTPERMEAMGS